MKTRMVFVRHGQSECNLEHRMQGQYDSPLTELGRRQAEACAEYMKDWHFDAAYASDLSRAYETCCRIAAPHKGLEVVKEPDFRELHAGKWQYMMPADIAKTYAEDYTQWRKNSWFGRPNGGESLAELAIRVFSATWKIARRHEGGTVLIATHYAPINMLQCAWLGYPFNQIKKTPPVKNVGVYAADYDPETLSFTPVLLGETKFLEKVDMTAGPADRV